MSRDLSTLWGTFLVQASKGSLKTAVPIQSWQTFGGGGVRPNERNLQVQSMAELEPTLQEQPYTSLQL